MKHLICALLLLPLVGCMNLDERFADARIEWGAALQKQAETQKEANAELAETVEESSAELAAGLKTVEEHSATVEAAAEKRDDAISDSVAALKESVGETWDDLKEGVEDDVEQAKATARNAAGGLFGKGALVDLGAAAIAAILGANAARNRNLPGTKRIPVAVKPNGNGDGGSNPST